MVEDECIGHHAIDRAFRAHFLRLRHAISDGLAAAELDFFAVADGAPVGSGQAHASAECEIFFDLN